jgi:hypothetical protein
MENDNNENNSLDEIRKRINGSGSDAPDLDPTNEIESGAKEKISGPSLLLEEGESSHSSERESEREENLKNKKLKEDKKLVEKIAGNIDAESESIGESKRDNTGMFTLLKERKSKDLTRPIILGIIFLIIAVGIVLFYFLSGSQKPNGEKESPQEIIKSSIEAMKDVKTYTTKGDVEINIKNLENSEQYTFDVGISGKFDQTDIDNTKSFYNMAIRGNVSNKDENYKFSVDFDSMFFGQEASYFRLNDVNLGMMEMMAGPEINQYISQYEGKWYLVDLEKIGKLGNSSPSFLGREAYNYDYDMGRVMELYSKYDILRFKSDLGNEMVGDVNTYHYKVKLNSKGFVNFYIDLLKEMSPKSEDDSYNEGYNEMMQKIEGDIRRYDYIINYIIENIDVEVWIGKKDKFMYKSRIAGKFDKEFLKTVGNKMAAKGDITEEEFNSGVKNMDDFEISFYLNFTADDFNKPVEIKKPEKTEDFAEIIEKMTPKFLMKGNIANFDSDKDGLTDNLEAFYGTDKNNPDTDGDGYNDGDEVNNGYDPLVAGDAKLDYDKLFNMKR